MHTIRNQCLSIKGGYWICAKWLMKVLVGQASLGQCILKAIKSNSVIPPLLFGLGVEINHATECYWQKYQSWDMLSPMMKLNDINIQYGWRPQTRSPQKWVYAVCSRARGP